MSDEESVASQPAVHAEQPRPPVDNWANNMADHVRESQQPIERKVANLDRSKRAGG